ncbi:MAG: hypothetical protein GY807_23515 [Gammaproteobacteria bacterium]|nr:hypothetical protein [Gammaproteobacteria bacterium]
MNELLKQELRAGWLGIGDPYQPIDFLGMAMGGYFIYDGVTRRGAPWVGIALGAIMVYIHSRRFVYAPKDRAGLIRLLDTLEVTPQELLGPGGQ